VSARRGAAAGVPASRRRGGAAGRRGGGAHEQLHGDEGGGQEEAILAVGGGAEHARDGGGEEVVLADERALAPRPVLAVAQQARRLQPELVDRVRGERSQHGILERAGRDALGGDAVDDGELELAAGAVDGNDRRHLLRRLGAHRDLVLRLDARRRAGGNLNPRVHARASVERRGGRIVCGARAREEEGGGGAVSRCRAFRARARAAPARRARRASGLRRPPMSARLSSEADDFMRCIGVGDDLRPGVGDGADELRAEPCDAARARAE
jgi:hypothetical protein